MIFMLVFSTHDHFTPLLTSETNKLRQADILLMSALRIYILALRHATE